MVAIFTEELRKGNVVIARKDKSGSRLVWKNVMNLRVSAVRWRCDDITKQYDDEMARFVEFSRMLENGTEWLHVTGTEPPSGILLLAVCHGGCDPGGVASKDHW
jgi:hypothetical protein